MLTGFGVFLIFATGLANLEFEMELQLKRINQCPACGCEELVDPVYRLKLFNVYDCIRCGVRFIDPSMTAEQQIDLYQNSQKLEKYFPELQEYYEYDMTDKASQTFTDYSLALEQAERLVLGRELCEVGCGTGAFLKHAVMRGWSVTGIDASVENSAALKRLGINSICADIFYLDPPRLYDCLVLWDVIEHPQNTRKLLNVCRKWIKPGGILLVATPCYPNLLSVIAGIFYRLTGGKLSSACEKMYMIVHTVYLSLPQLKEILDRAGYRFEKGWKTETDLSRYFFKPVVRFALQSAFFLARITGLQNRAIAIARVPE